MSRFISAFKFICLLDKGDQRLFRHKKTGKWEITDESADWPELTDDGACYIDRGKPLTIGEHGVSIPIEGGYFAGTTFKGARKLLKHVRMEVVTTDTINKDRIWLLNRVKVLMTA